MSTYSEYVATMEKQMKKWDADVEALQAEGRLVSDQARQAYETNLLQLRASREAAQNAFQQVSVASESAGAQVKAGMEVAWSTMLRALEKVSSELESGNPR
jgi:hypothetical protein